MMKLRSKMWTALAVLLTFSLACPGDGGGGEEGTEQDFSGVDTVGDEVDAPAEDGNDESLDVSAEDTADTESDPTEGEIEEDAPVEDAVSDTDEPGEDVSVGDLPEDNSDVNENPACDTFAQDCSEGNCVPWSSDGSGVWDATTCAPVDENPDQPGEACTVQGAEASGVDSCDVGALCWNVSSEDNTGACIALCSGIAENPICEDDDQVCAQLGSAAVCAQRCDPLLQDCAGDQTCTTSDVDSFGCLPVRTAPGGGLLGNPCDAANSCLAGLACVSGSLVSGCESDRCCAAFCDVSDPVCLAMGHECTAWYEDGSSPPGYEDVGICVKPL